MLLDDLKDRVMEYQGETIYVVGTGGTVLTEYNKNILETQCRNSEIIPLNGHSH